MEIPKCRCLGVNDSDPCVARASQEDGYCDLCRMVCTNPTLKAQFNAKYGKVGV